MTKEEKAVVRAAIDCIAARGLYKKANLEQAVLRYSAKKAEEIRDAGLADRSQTKVAAPQPLGEAVLCYTASAGKPRPWEYYVWLPSDPDLFLHDLGELGQRGWELVMRQPDNIYVFKRPMLQCGEEEQDEFGS